MSGAIKQHWERVLITNKKSANHKAAAVKIELHGIAKKRWNFASRYCYFQVNGYCWKWLNFKIVWEQSSEKCLETHHSFTTASGSNKKRFRLPLTSTSIRSLQKFRSLSLTTKIWRKKKKLKTFNQHFPKTRARNSIKKEERKVHWCRKQ